MAPKTSRWKTPLLATALALIAAAIVYAALGPKRGKQQRAASPTIPAVAATSTVPASSSSPRRSGPKIQFATMVYDFGKANGDDQVDCLFVFTNTGNAALEVSDVSPGCGCMKAGAWTRTVEPGQTGTIPVRYDSRHYTGYFAKSVFVTCNDPTQPKPLLEIKGTVWRPVEITPQNAVLNLSAESPSNSTFVRIISHMEEPLTLSNLRVSSSAFAVELQTNSPGKEYQLHIRTAPPWPTNNQQGQITLNSSATNSPLISISALANVQPVVTTIPYQLRLPAPPLTNGTSALLWVRNNGTNALTLSEPVVNAKDVTVQLAEDQPGRMMTLTLNFPPGFEIPPGENVALRVKSNHPQFPVITVPILQPSRPAVATAGSVGK